MNLKISSVLSFFQGAQKEEKNGQLILEEFLDAECADGDDDDSAWEDVDEEEEDHPEGDDKHTCGNRINYLNGSSRQKSVICRPKFSNHLSDKVTLVRFQVTQDILVVFLPSRPPASVQITVHLSNTPPSQTRIYPCHKHHAILASHLGIS